MSISKAQVVSLNNNGPSSEASESRTVEEHTSVTSTNTSRSVALNRAKNSWRRMKELAAEKEKENESKRPPWRAVSQSTLSKPDRNALLRAKLLDASRRLRAGKANVGIQTDFTPTKLMKEASLPVQTDLIFYKDVGILTDGQYTKKKDGYNQYVLTYSISQMTEMVETKDVCTQTLLPKFYNEEASDSIDCVDMEVLDSDKKVAIQIAKLRKFYIESGGSLNSIQNSLLKPTLHSWHFDDDIIEIDSKQQFIPYIIEPQKPWRSFVPFPFLLRGKLIGTQRIDWYALLQSIDVLIRESNNLVDKLEQILEKKMQHNQNFKKLPKFRPTQYISPSAHWLPIIEKQEKDLQIMIKQCNETIIPT